MSSVLIKGMEMPKNCDECFFIGRGYPDWCSLPQISNGEDEIDDTKKRPDWCPLIELPEKHGRLIDADEFIKKMNLAISMLSGMIKEFGAEDDAELQMELKSYRDVRDGIKEEPTIIEAEGDEE